MSSEFNNAFKHKGTQKQWIYQSDQCNLAHDYLEKARNVLQDFEPLRKQLSTREQIAYAIILMAWMCEAVDRYQHTLLPAIYNQFSYSQEELWKSAQEYQRAIRSFIVAHPLSTNRHGKFSFDGDTICIDIMPPDYQNSAIFRSRCNMRHSEVIKHISWDGIASIPPHKDDFLVMYYSATIDKSQYHHFLSFNAQDIAKVIDLCVDRLSEIDRYLSKLKKKDFIS